MFSASSLLLHLSCSAESVCVCVSSRLSQESWKLSQNVCVGFVFACVIMSSEDVLCCITFSGSRRMERELSARILLVFFGSWSSAALLYWGVSQHIPVTPRPYRAAGWTLLLLFTSACLLVFLRGLWYDSVQPREEVIVEFHFTASLLTMLRYSCPLVYTGAALAFSNLSRLCVCWMSVYSMWISVSQTAAPVKPSDIYPCILYMQYEL